MTAQAPTLAIKRPFGLVPADAWSEDRMEAMPLETVVELKCKRSRSVPQLNLYWAVLSEICKATDMWPSARHLHDLTLMDLEYRTLAQRLDGKKHWIADSIAFDKMKQEEFNTYTDRAFARLSEVVGYDVLQAYEEMRGSRYPGATSMSPPAPEKAGDGNPAISPQPLPASYEGAG